MVQIDLVLLELVMECCLIGVAMVGLGFQQEVAGAEWFVGIQEALVVMMQVLSLWASSRVHQMDL